MQKIRKLSAHETQKIAAGQVVERPANVVKELVENAIDAGATRISVWANDGGKTLIRVLDNGCGMGEVDAHLCFEPHATSKLVTVDQIATIDTFGFRGEALASIAAVSKVTLITKEATATAGVKLHLEAGAVLSTQAVACTTGTDITITDLFYQTPARKKFLKADQTEWRHIMQLVQAFGLSYPEIQFVLQANDELIFNCPAVKTSRERCAQLWDHHVDKSLLAIQATREKPVIEVTGMISNHQLWKYDRSTMFIFVNKRWVKNQKLGSAVLKGYQNVLPHGKFPCVYVSISIDPHSVDINVHPRKEEVSFSHPRMVEQLIEQAVKAGLEKKIVSSVGTQHFTPFQQQTNAHVSPTPELISFAKTKPVRQLNEPMAIFAQPTSFVTTVTYAQQSQSPSVAEAVQQPVPFSAQHTICADAESYTLIGQFNNTYLIVQKGDALLLIDQHAAHERILYEQFANRFVKLDSIQLLFAHIVPLSPADLALLLPHLCLFEENGMVIEPFGDDQLIISAVPVHLKSVALADLVHQVIVWIKEETGTAQADFFKILNEKLRAQMACKAAVKAGDELSVAQMQELLQQFDKTPNNFSCPHGRPTTWSLPLLDIERKFRRK